MGGGARCGAADAGEMSGIEGGRVGRDGSGAVGMDGSWD